MEEGQHAFMTGCRKAVIQYVSAKERLDYNANSPWAFCDNQRAEFVPYLESLAIALGRKVQ
jgi:hypothetical protein